MVKTRKKVSPSKSTKAKKPPPDPVKVEIIPKGGIALRGAEKVNGRHRLKPGGHRFEIHANDVNLLANGLVRVLPIQVNPLIFDIASQLFKIRGNGNGAKKLIRFITFDLKGEVYSFKLVTK